MSTVNALAYLRVRGPVDEVIAASNLPTYVVSARSGESISLLNQQLEHKAGVDMVAPFGTSLHVSGRDAAALEAAISPYRERGDLEWRRSEASLEDVFIDLMGRARDNFQ